VEEVKRIRRKNTLRIKKLTKKNLKEQKKLLRNPVSNGTNDVASKSN
jgi:hypothetical protein